MSRNAERLSQAPAIVKSCKTVKSKMKMKSKGPSPSRRAPTDDEIRDYALHLFQQSGCVPGLYLENWLEARLCLEANLTKRYAQARVRRRRRPQPADEVTLVAIRATVTRTMDELESDGGFWLGRLSFTD